MAPGNVVEYLEGKDLALAFCLAGEVKGKLAVLTSTGRKESLAAKKILFVHGSPLSATASREEVLDHLRAAEKERQDGCDGLDLEELWELLLEEGEDRDWRLDELTAFLFCDQVGELQKSLAYRALTDDRTHFWRKAESFRIRTREQVEESLARQRTEAKRELERAALRDWLRTVWDNGPVEPPEEYRAFIEDWIGRIRDAAIWGEKSSHHGHVQRLLKDLDNKTNDPAFHFMVRLGEWTNDQNLDLLLNGTPLEFPPEVVEAAEGLKSQLEVCLAEEDREDLTAWPCYSIDDPDTTEVDDALAFRATDSGYELGIHIADASALLAPSLTVLEEEIRERATSVYLPDLKVRMVPEVLSDHLLSLIAGEPRLAFSFLVRLDKNGRLLSSRITPSKIMVTQRFDYDAVDALVAAGDPYWLELAELAEKLKALREAKGALNLPFPRMDVRLDANNKVSLVPDERESIAQTIVSEAMIMANRVAADYTADNNLPAIYRGQKAPDPPVEMRAQWLPHHLFDLRKALARSSQSLEPCPHAGLGLDRYIQATSPIRRYRDLVHQRQIKHHLQHGTALYDSAAMEEILTHTSAPVSAAEKMERNRRAYFLHKYLKAQRGSELEAVVLASTTERCVLQLCESLREVEVPHGPAGLKAPGDKVRVKLLSVYPRDRVVKVSSPI
jgi:exoribonuclease-2